MRQQFTSNGKLLLTGEYVVLDGALSLALPTSYGQSLTVIETGVSELVWKSLDHKGIVWFETVLELRPKIRFGPSVKKNTIRKEQLNTVEMLLKILNAARQLNPAFLSEGKGYAVTTKLDFPRNWGLGSSSTLINNVAQWAQVDAYQLLQRTFGGSGYDIACARHNHPIHYLRNANTPQVKKVEFSPTFADRIYFVHLNKKQNSREGIAQYRKVRFDQKKVLEKISEITENVTLCKSLSAFESLLTAHETLLSEVLGIPTVKASLFPSFKGAIKSLGAWGGDFILATGNEKLKDYFNEKGYDTVIPFSEMILS